MSNNSIFVENKSIQSLKVVIDELFQSDERICIDESISYTALLSYAKEYDNDVITTLYNSEETRLKFFKKISDTHIFHYEKLDTFVNSSLIKNSYTRYKNQIGLFIKDNSDVVLNFPFKDCYLQGGQTEDEAKREEIFFNEVIAFDEIDMLLSEKAFCNFTKYTKNGKEDFNGFRRDKNGTIKDNLLIKGNNLLALHSLKYEFKNKVKLIYIDPPYNTGKDSFKYNDKFNHSAWLVFMKNRLEVAKELLRDDGVIFVQCDDNEQAYLKILMDEIFKRENFLTNFIWNSTKSVTNTAIVSVSHTHTLVYFKSIRYIIGNRTEFRLPEDGEGFENPDNDPRGLWKADPFQVGGWRPNQQYEILNPNTQEIYKPNEGCSWKNDYNKFQELIRDNRIVFGSSGNAGPQRKRFLSEAMKRGKVVKTIWDNVDTTTNGTQHLIRLFGKPLFSNPKPEKLIQRIIEISTKENDIVLDFCVGSGTTLVAAHKMKRQYIGVEQMDYIETITAMRLQKVIEGEQGGISKSVEWQGGGEFVYFELAKFNEKCKEIIMAVTDSKQFKSLFDEIENKFFICYEEDVLKFKNEINNEKSDFYKLTLKEQKIEFINKLDLNQMYVPKSECEDEIYELNSNDIELTKDFYGEV